MPTMKQANHSIYLAGQGGEGIDVTPDGHRTGADGRVRRGGSVRPEPALLDGEEGMPVVPSKPSSEALLDEALGLVVGSPCVWAVNCERLIAEYRPEHARCSRCAFLARPEVKERLTADIDCYPDEGEDERIIQ